ncbi:MAG: type II secretion system protein [Planctomycetota bacterium]|nr:type II secretion system protein [Planctomycetota bacterium]
MNKRCGANRGFTIVEILVVISIIAVLLGLLLPALSGVKKRSRKMQEINAIRQVGMAWNLYANANNEAAIPGYLEPAVQDYWKVGYEYPNGATIPPAPGYGAGVPNIAGPWTWRLLPNMDNNHEMVHGYRDEPDWDLLQMAGEGEIIADEPGFGYNAYYVGGWWEMVDFNGNEIPRYRFYDATIPSLGAPGGSARRVSVVVRSVAQIRRSSELVIFCSSAERPPGEYHKVEDNVPGSHMVVPPFLADQPQWSLSPLNPGTPTIIEVLAGSLSDPISVPIGRYTGFAAVLYADGHADRQAPGALVDQRKWINIADQGAFQHLE